MERSVDIAILGAGTAGLSAMSQVRKATNNFVLINGGELGTTCARVGCMPSKALIQVAEDVHRKHVFSREGIEGGDNLRADIEEVMEHVRDIRDIFVDRVLSHSTDEMGDELVEGYASFLEPDLLQVGEQRIRAKKVIIATGSSPIVPTPWRELGDRIMTTDQFFEQQSLPQSVVVIGLGVIGLELGQALHRLGVKVLGVDQLDTVAGIEDPVVGPLTTKMFDQEFPLWLGHQAELNAHGEQLEVRCGERQMVVDQALVCIGRRPNLSHLNLDRIGVSVNQDGVPDFDQNTLQVANLPIFIAGDVNHRRPILHEAGNDGRIAGFNATQDKAIAFKRRTPLAINFCDPNIAFIGQQWAELEEHRTVVGEMRIGPVGRALIKAQNKGIIRVYVDQQSARVLGACLVSTSAENLAHLLAWAIEQQMDVFQMLKMPFYHPTMEEALQGALYDAMSKLSYNQPYPVELTPLP